MAISMQTVKHTPAIMPNTNCGMYIFLTLLSPCGKFFKCSSKFFCVPIDIPAARKSGRVSLSFHVCKLYQKIPFESTLFNKFRCFHNFSWKLHNLTPLSAQIKQHKEESKNKYHAKRHKAGI